MEPVRIGLGLFFGVPVALFVIDAAVHFVAFVTLPSTRDPAGCLTVRPLLRGRKAGASAAPIMH